MIFLIGYRGTGKTTIARLLAERLGWPWLDADAILEARHGRCITDIFARDGEPVFREMESAVLKDLCRLERHVIATGGGVVLSEANRERMRQTGRIVWLQADVDTIWERIQTDAEVGKSRPALIAGGRAEVEELLRVREPLYQACTELAVKTTGRSPAEVVEEILASHAL